MTARCKIRHTQGGVDEAEVLTVRSERSEKHIAEIEAKIDNSIAADPSASFH